MNNKQPQSPDGDEEMFDDDYSQDLLDCGNRVSFDEVMSAEDSDLDDDYYDEIRTSGYPDYADYQDEEDFEDYI